MNIRIAHMADTHLGYRQYGLLEREKDFYDSFNNIIDDIIDKNVDYVIHSGDLFESSRPPIEAISVAQNGFNRLKEHGIGIYVIAGNHDIMQRYQTVLPQKLFEDEKFRIFSTTDNSVILEDKIFLGGLPYLNKKYEDEISTMLSHMYDKAKDYDYKILMLHGAISKYFDFQPEFELTTIPKGFDYYAMGHLHKRIIDDFNEGVLSYPGSTEIRSKDELNSYRSDSKGYNLITIDDSKKNMNIEYVNIPLEREFIDKVINYSNLESGLDTLREEIENLSSSKKPLVYLKINNGRFDKSEVYNTITDKLDDLTLKTNITYDPLNDDEDITYDAELLTPERAIEEQLNERYDNNKLITDLGVNLYKSLNESTSSAIDTAQEYYNKIY
ncbi:MAG: DNA repair exonuclease, partial [Methanosphaera sp.]|nr:DNA repair exonuclease [Methanosphaera sp.]